VGGVRVVQLLHGVVKAVKKQLLQEGVENLFLRKGKNCVA